MKNLTQHLKKYRVLYLLTLLFVAMIIVHIYYNYAIYGDDATFYVYFPELFSSLFEFLKFRYNSWTSRMSVEVVMYCFINSRIAFAILDSLLYVVLAYSLYLLFDKKSILISIIAVCMFPFYHYKSCGLYAASTNYTWPIAFLAYGLVCVKKIIKNQKLNVVEIILMLFSFVFVSFVEICTVLMILYLIGAMIYHYMKNKKISPMLIIATAIAVFGIIFMMLSPGNANRRVQELKYFPEYAEFNIIQKLMYGLVFVGNANSLLPCAVNICFYVLLIILAFKNNKDKLTKVCSLAPVVMFALFYVVYFVASLVNKNLNFDFLFYANDLVFNEIFIYILCAYATLISLFPLITLLKIYKGEQRIFLVLSYIVSIGMLGSFGLNGSISFFANYRPTIFSSLVMIIVCLEMFYSLKQINDKNYNGELFYKN